MAVSPAAIFARRMNNVYELAGYPDCFTPYNGERRSDTAVIVGFGTEHEELFFKRDIKHAVARAKSYTPSLAVDQLPYTQVCEQAILDLLAR